MPLPPHYRKPLATARPPGRLRLLWAVLGLLSCGGEPVPDGASPLQISAESYDFSAAPDLLERLRTTPHTYFRFINREFTQEVCHRYAELVDRLPRMNLHGDAHLEQYAVTDSGRGLTDFDDSAVGPALVDLVRFGTSVALTADANGWSEQQRRLVAAMFAGVRQGVRSPDARPPAPAVVGRIRMGFDQDRLSLLRSMDSLMTVEGSRDSFRLEAGLDLYRESMFAEHPELPPDFFTMKRGGRLTLGVGSALDDKYLLRIEGMSPSPEDDLVLEAKPVRDLSGITCLERRSGDAFQIMTGQARIAYQPYQYMGYVFLDPRRAQERGLGPDFWDGSTYWIHAWVDNYVEVDVTRSFATIEELEEVVFDVGVQLGRGHPKDIASPHESQLRRAMVQWLDDHETDIQEAIDEMTALVLSAWDAFRLQAGAEATTGP
jgi:hypothetical protein